MNIPEVCVEVVNLAERLGVRDINRLVGCWEVDLGDGWWVAVNGHREATACSRGKVVPPFAMYFELGGWPAGIVHPRTGGTLCAGAREDELLRVLKATGAGA